MKTTRFLLIATATALGLGGFINTEALSADKDSPMRPRGRLLQNAKEKLNLTDDQVARIKTEVKSEKDNLKSLLERLRDARSGLREAIHASTASEASVRAASAKVADVEADLAVERLKLFGKISPILTDEQREKLKEFRSQMDEFIDKAINRVEERLSE